MITLGYSTLPTSNWTLWTGLKSLRFLLFAKPLISRNKQPCVALRIQPRSWTNGDGTITRTWRLIVEDYSTGSRQSFYPPKTDYPRYGLNPGDSYELAVEKLKIIRSKNKTERREERRAAVMARIKRDDQVKSAYLPDKIYTHFIKWLMTRRMWTALPSKTESHLRCMRKLIVEVKLDPSKWAENPEKIYTFFFSHKLSPSYVEKVFPLINAYGYFYCREMGRPFLSVPHPRGFTLRRIEDSYLDKNGGHTNESLPIAPAQLNCLSGLPEAQLRWMRLSVWFGLRPEEIDSLTDANHTKTWRVTIDTKKTPILHVYQTKLVRIDRKRRWKRIPCILPEQTLLINELKRRLPTKRPYSKTLQARLGHGHRLYGGRKGFEKLMRDHGQDFRNISRWLGHSDLNRTESNYREIEAVEYTPIR